MTSRWTVLAISMATALTLFLGLDAVRGWADDKTESKSASKAEDKGERKKVVKTDEEWRRALTWEQYLVTRRKATEPAFSGRYATGHHVGTFVCIGCGTELFSSRTKFNSGTGWPSFWNPIAADVLERAWDYEGPMPRVEVTCSTCGAHLGHVFDDGPPPTGLRYCINSVAIKLVKPTPASLRGATSSKVKSKAKAKGIPSKKTSEDPSSPEKENAPGQPENQAKGQGPSKDGSRRSNPVPR